MLRTNYRRPCCVYSALALASLLAISCHRRQQNATGAQDNSSERIANSHRGLVESMARELYARGYLDNTAADSLRPTLIELTARTKFAGLLHVNDGFSEATLNVFIIRPHACVATDGMCAYARANTIFCDSGFLSNYI